MNGWMDGYKTKSYKIIINTPFFFLPKVDAPLTQVECCGHQGPDLDHELLKNKSYL